MEELGALRGSFPLVFPLNALLARRGWAGGHGEKGFAFQIHGAAHIVVLLLLDMGSLATPMASKCF